MISCAFNYSCWHVTRTTFPSLLLSQALSQLPQPPWALCLFLTSQCCSLELFRLGLWLYASALLITQRSLVLEDRKRSNLEAQGKATWSQPQKTSKRYLAQSCHWGPGNESTAQCCTFTQARKKGRGEGKSQNQSCITQHGEFGIAARSTTWVIGVEFVPFKFIPLKCRILCLAM